MTWVTENPVPVLVVGGAAVVLPLVGLFATRDGRFLFAAAIAAVVVFALVITEHFIVTEAEEVESAVGRLAAAIEANDLEGVIAGISPAADELRSAARANLPRVHVISVKVSGLETEVAASQTPHVGRARFRATVYFSAPGFGNQPSYDAWELTFLRDEGEWLLVDAVMRSEVGPDRVLPLVPGPNGSTWRSAPSGRPGPRIARRTG